MNSSFWQVEIDGIDKLSWEQLVAQFNDATICQTWAYGISSGKKISHIIIRKAGEIRACCQVMLRRIPFFNIDIATIKWGPLCIKKGEEYDQELLVHSIRAIKEEFAIKRGCLIDIEPHAIGEGKRFLKRILESEGFRINPIARPYKTLKLDLTPSLEDLRSNFLQKWRNCLNKAERSELEIVEGKGDDLYQLFLMIGHKMVIRKSLNKALIHDIQIYRQIQENLPDEMKMKIMIGKKDSKPISAAICSALGDTAIYLFGATDKEALRFNVSYILQWKMMQWMKGIGVRYYDLGAFNPEENPGVYHFKLGVAGKMGWEEIFMGEYFGCFNLSGKLAQFMLVSARFLRKVWTWRLKLRATN